MAAIGPNRQLSFAHYRDFFRARGIRCMESSGIVITIAQLAVALAGFSGVIVGLNPIPIRDWSPLDRLNFRILLQVSAVTAFFAIIPFPMHVLFEADLAWRTSLLIYGAYHVLDVASFILKLPKDALLINRLLSGMGLFVAVVQIMVGVVSESTIVEFTYLAALVWHLSVAFAGFVILVYAIRGGKTERAE